MLGFGKLMRGFVDRKERLAPSIASLPGGSGFESTRYLARWLILGSVIGLVAGLGAVAFDRAIVWSTQFFLGELVGYMPPAPVGEGESIRRAFERAWALPLVTGLGGLVSGIIVSRLAPEAEGHGTDAAIEALHYRSGRLRFRVAPVKLAASAITIGSGGSAGREGPTAQISASFASTLSDRIGLDPQNRRIAVSAGMAAGIGAIFRAPLGGALMGAEILYIHDLEVEAIIPCLIASIVSFSVFGTMEGFDPIFGAQPNLGFEHPGTIAYYAILGAICGLVGLLYARSFYGVSSAFHRMRLPMWLKPAIGGLMVGCIGLIIPGALGSGYGWIQIGMSAEVMSLPLWTIMLLPFAKILSTSLSIGSGGSGGIFGPGMVIGGMLGIAFWRLGDGVLPGLPETAAPFAIVGMMALFGGIAHAPLAVMLMVAEMTGNLTLLAPAMVAVAISTALVGDNSIYRSQLPTRADSPAYRVRLSFPLLSSLHVRDAMRALRTPGQEIDDTLRLSPNLPLDEAIEQISEAERSHAVVVEANTPVGTVSIRDILTTYRATLARSVRRSQALSPDTTLIELQIGPYAAVAGHTLSDASLPGRALVVGMTRDGQAIFPQASTQLKAGDMLMVMGDPAVERELHELCDSDHRQASPGGP
ncbi:MAG: chloride channel protein [Thermomicrobiales bacterium]|nr:chloride channel protein [Thermomicrobiales bacterium]